MKHKNFVSMAALLILVLSAVFLVTACPTGTGPSSGSNSGGTLTPPAVSAEETELTALLGKISLDKAIITTAPETITISNLPSAAGVTAEIASNNIELIEYEATTNQLKVKALPPETTDVKITITLTKNSTSKSMDFTVKVFKSGDTPSEEDYLAALTIPLTVSDDFDLPKELQNGTPITWSTENPDIIGIEGAPDKIAVVIPDLIEKKVKLTATANGKERVFEVKVLPVVKTEINNGPNDKKVYEFTQNGITIKEFQDDKLLRGNLYSYTLDDTNKQITVRLTSVFSPEGTWITIEEYYSLITDMNITLLKNQLESIDALLSKPTISIAELKEAFKNFPHEDVSGYNEQEFFENVLKKPPYSFTETYEQFTALSPQEQTEKIKAILIGLKKEIAKQFGLPEDASTEDILAELKKQLQQQAAQEIKEAKEPYTYTYAIRKDLGGNLHFETSVVYNPSKAWYENRGNWNYHPASPETSWISNIDAREIPGGPIEGDLSMQENHTSKHYEGTITGNGPNYTFNGSRKDNPGEQITATITDNQDGTITVTVTEGGSASSRLKFEGNSLLIWR